MTAEWTTTTTILRDLRNQRNNRAWDQFVGQFQWPIVRFARHFGIDSDSAEDVAQETLAAFARAYKQGRYDRTRGRLSNWLFGFAYRHVLQARDSQARRPAAGLATTFWQRQPDQTSAQTYWRSQWDREVLNTCIEQARLEFANASFQAFELSVRKGVSAKQIAEQLNMNIKAVYNAKHRVLNRIRELSEAFDSLDAPIGEKNNSEASI